MRRGDGPAITAPGKCERITYVGGRQFKVVQTWRLKAGRGVELTTKLIDPKAGKGAAATNTGFSEACEAALSKLAREKADEIMKGKREAARRRGVPQARGGGADNDMSCPVIAAIRESHEGVTTRTTTSSAKPAAVPEVGCVACVLLKFKILKINYKQ